MDYRVYLILGFWGFIITLLLILIFAELKYHRSQNSPPTSATK